MSRKLLIPILVVTLVVSACNTPGGATTTPTGPGPVSASPTTPPPAPTPSGLTMEALRNGTYYAPFYKRTVALTDGTYSEGTGTQAYSVHMLGVYAIGDLNGDGLDDAAILLDENGGGTGQFESLVAVLDAGGAPHQAGQAELGDRVRINSVAISSGEIGLDMVVQGPKDPLCCPSQPEVQTYRLVDGSLWMARLTSRTPDGTERAINVESPADGTEVTNPFTVSGSVTISPFENNLACRIYLPDGTLVNESSLLVNSTGMGTPGTFSRDFDLSNAGLTGKVIIQFLDLSAANGDTLDMDSVVLTIH